MRHHRLTHLLRSPGLKGACGIALILLLSSSSIHAQTEPASGASKEVVDTDTSADTPQAPPTEAPTQDAPAAQDTPPTQADLSEEPGDAATATLERCMISRPEREQVTARLKKMRPKPAARMLAAMSPELAADLLLRLDARQSARILNELPPRTGATLLTLLSTSSDTP